MHYRNFSFFQNFHIILFREENQVSRHGWLLLFGLRSTGGREESGKEEEKKKTKKERPEFFKRDHVAILLAIFTSFFTRFSPA